MLWCRYEQLLLKPHMNIVKVLGVCLDALDSQLRLVMQCCVQSVHDLVQTAASKVRADFAGSSHECRAHVLGRGRVVKGGVSLFPYS